MSEDANKEAGTRERTPTSVQTLQRSIKKKKRGKKEKSKMSPTFGEKIQKANAPGPNVFTETASLRCVFGHNLPSAGVAEQL